MEDYSSLMRNLPKREGSRPSTSSEGPHSQTSDQSSPELWGRLLFLSRNLPHVIEGKSSVSPITSRALLFDDLQEIGRPESSLSPNPPLEPVHIHGVHDTSIHLCLPKERATQVCELGWAEPHKFADYDCEVMVYGPRNEDELQIVMTLIKESLAFARAH